MDLTRNFRYSKHELELSLSSVLALKSFLIRNGHVMVLHILQTWFSIEISDTKNVDPVGETDVLQASDEIVETDVVFKKPHPAAGNIAASPVPVERKLVGCKLKALRQSVRQLNTHEKPMRVFNVLNADNR